MSIKAQHHSEEKTGGGTNPYPPGLNWVQSYLGLHTVSSILLTPDESVLYCGHYNGNLTKNILTAPADLSPGITSIDFGGGTMNTNRSISRGQNGLTLVHSEGTPQATIHQRLFNTQDDWTSATSLSDSQVYAIPQNYTYSLSGMEIKPDGLSVFISTGWWQNPKGVFEMRTPVAWDFTQLSFNNHQWTSGGWAPGQIRFTPDGLRAFVTDQTNNRILQWENSTAWDWRTRGPATGIRSLGWKPNDILWSENGRKLFVTTDASASIEEFTANPAYTIQ